MRCSIPTDVPRLWSQLHRRNGTSPQTETQRTSKRLIPGLPSYGVHNKHKVDSQNIRIVDRDSGWFQRGAREAIQIRSRSPTLNRDRGRHNPPSSTTPSYGHVTRAWQRRTWPKSELMKVDGCQQKASHLRNFTLRVIRLNTISWWK